MAEWPRGAGSEGSSRPSEPTSPPAEPNDFFSRMGRITSDASLASLAQSVASGGSISRIASVSSMGGMMIGSGRGSRMYSGAASPCSSPVNTMWLSPPARGYCASPTSDGLFDGEIEAFELPPNNLLAIKVSLADAPDPFLPTLSTSKQGSDAAPSSGPHSPTLLPREAHGLGAGLQTDEAALTPIPLRVIGLLCMAQIAHFYSMCSIFSYAGFLTVDAGWVDSEDQAGFVAGLLATMLPLGRLPTSVPWGYVADRAGRRPALIGSMLGVCFGSIAFAFCTSLPLALAVRFFFLGGGNGWNSILGPICAENGGLDGQARLIGYVFGAGGVVNLLGPAIGGFTYGMGWFGLGERFPSMAPSLIGAALGATAALMAYLWLPETRPVAVAIAPAPPNNNDGRGNDGEMKPPDAVVLGVRLTDTSEAKDGWVNEGARSATSLGEAMRRVPMPAVLLLRSGIGFAAFAAYDVIPLWAIASIRAGGVALPQKSLGLLLSIAAAIQLLWTSLAMGPVMTRLGSRRTFYSACIVGGSALVLLPNAYRLPLHVIAMLVAFQSAALNTACTSSIVATNEAVEIVAPQLAGALNGVIVTVESVAKALGPAVGAPLFAFAISARPVPEGPPSGAQATFTIFAAFVLLHGAAASRYLRGLVPSERTKEML